MESNIIALTQKDLYKLGYNCYLYENDLHTHKNLCEALGYQPSIVKYFSCYQVAYCCNAYGNSGQLHRVELELLIVNTLQGSFTIHQSNIRINKYRLFINLFFILPCCLCCNVYYILRLIGEK